MVKRILILVLLLLASPVMAQVHGWPPYYPHGKSVAYTVLGADTAEAAMTMDQFADYLSRISYQSWRPDTIGSKLVKDANRTWEISTTGVAAWISPALKASNGSYAGANKSWQMLLDSYTGTDMYFQTMDIWYCLRYRFGAAVTAYSGGAEGVGRSGQFVGIQIGTPAYSGGSGAYPPWPSAPTSPYARLGLKPYTGKIVLDVGVGDGIKAPLVVDVGDYAVYPNGVYSPNDHLVAPFLELEWDPYAPALRAYVNHVLVYAVTDTAAMPHWGQNDVTDYPSATPSDYANAAGGLFVESGTQSDSKITGTWVCPYRMLFHPATNGGGALVPKVTYFP
jgi:hypothetical protein